MMHYDPPPASRWESFEIAANALIDELIEYCRPRAADPGPRHLLRLAAQFDEALVKVTEPKGDEHGQ